MLGAQRAGHKGLECKELPSHVCSSARSRQGFNLTSWLDAGNSQISVEAKQIWPPTAWSHSAKRGAVVETSLAPATWHHTHNGKPWGGLFTTGSKFLQKGRRGGEEEVRKKKDHASIIKITKYFYFRWLVGYFLKLFIPFLFFFF